MVAGLGLGDGRGAGLAAWGMLTALFVGIAAPRGAFDAGQWRRFQGHSRLAVAAGAALAVALSIALTAGDGR